MEELDSKDTLKTSNSLVKVESLEAVEKFGVVKCALRTEILFRIGSNARVRGSRHYSQCRVGGVISGLL